MGDYSVTVYGINLGDKIKSVFGYSDDDCQKIIDIFRLSSINQSQYIEAFSDGRGYSCLFFLVLQLIILILLISIIYI